MATKEYTKSDMVRDFTNPAEYVKTTDLTDKGNLLVTSIAQTESEAYGKSYAVVFEDDKGNALMSYISAKHPYTICDEFKDALIGCTVQFTKTLTKDKKTILKMRLVVASESLTAMLENE